MKEDKNRSAYQKDLASGILDIYKGEFVAYKDGQIFKEGDNIFSGTERQVLEKVTDKGECMIQQVGFTPTVELPDYLEIGPDGEIRERDCDKEIN